MKSLWIVNKCCGALHEKIYGKKATGGQWLDAMLDEARTHADDAVVVVNIEANPSISQIKDGNITYYTIRGGQNEKYNHKDPAQIAAWRKIYERERPDVTVIWGSEFTYSLAAMTASPSTPSVLYVQGILDSIAKYYTAGLNEKELHYACSLRDLLQRNTIRQKARNFNRRAEYEREIIVKSGHIIIENEWARAYCEKIYSEVQAHYLPISICSEFRNHSWNEAQMMPHTLMCSAADYPLKGLHMLLRALAIIKKKYPDVRLFVPGAAFKQPRGLKAALKQNGFSRWILKLTDELDLTENIVYTGRLTADEMAQKMSEVSAFAMCSAIENHSSTLKEAMTVGTPCVASYVGGVPEYAKSEENCLLYRFEDYEVLAKHVCRLFEDKDLRAKLSTQASNDMRKPKEESDYEAMLKILNHIIKGS